VLEENWQTSGIQHAVARVTANTVNFSMNFFAQLYSTYRAPGSDRTLINIEEESREKVEFDTTPKNIEEQLT